MTHEADDVLSLDLVHPDGKPLPDWAPGAHIDLHAGGQVRQYSLCGDPADTGRYRIAVLRAPDSRGGSAFVHRELRPGATVTVGGPRNHFPPADAGTYVFIAGGIGVTPLLVHAREAAARGRNVRFWYGGRTRSSMAFTEEITALAGATADSAVALHPKDESGRIDLRAVLAQVVGDTRIYCCGPESLVAETEALCTELALHDRLHVERFAGVKAEAPEEGERAFEVECVRSGQTVTVGPDESIVDALEDAGVYVEASCRDGVCGTCETRVIEGAPDHRDTLLSGEQHAAGDVMMLCVSRCASKRLVLDI
ncbi:PDR/VanB family oxidoreductase [Streptomyces sp. NPDC059533]|uniref:PDR/VanB family oxidoreductase n=1 Tax=unclassified Streptomyces TaxID=2593676 RepID=UPI003647A84B